MEAQTSGRLDMMIDAQISRKAQSVERFALLSVSWLYLSAGLYGQTSQSLVHLPPE